MSEFAKVFDLLAGEGRKIAEDGGKVIEDGGEASEDIGRVTVDGAKIDVEASNEAIKKEVEEGIEEGKESVKDELDGKPPAPEPIFSLANARAAGKWIGVELAKGALFWAGMEGIEDLVGAAQSAISNLLTKQQIDSMTATNKTLKGILDGWLKWVADHGNKEGGYGMVKVDDDTEISQVEIMVSQFGGVTKLVDNTLSPLQTAALKEKSPESIKNLHDGMISLVEKMQAVSKRIKTQAGMMADGLKDNSEELKTAKKTLEDAS